MRYLIGTVALVAAFGTAKLVGYIREFLAALENIAPECGEDDL